MAFKSPADQAYSLGNSLFPASSAYCTEHNNLNFTWHYTVNITANVLYTLLCTVHFIKM